MLASWPSRLRDQVRVSFRHDSLAQSLHRSSPCGNEGSLSVSGTIRSEPRSPFGEMLRSSARWRIRWLRQGVFGQLAVGLNIAPRIGNHSMHADLVFRNGPIITVDDEYPAAEAVAVRATGSRASARDEDDKCRNRTGNASRRSRRARTPARAQRQPHPPDVVWRAARRDRRESRSRPDTRKAPGRISGRHRERRTATAAG